MGLLRHFSSKSFSVLTSGKNKSLDSNHGNLVSESLAVPAEPQPLPIEKFSRGKIVQTAS